MLDVVDGFFRIDENLLTTPGPRLYEFGQEVLRFYAAAEQVAVPGSKYIGGWPSASYLEREPSGLLSNLLLFETQIVIKDPLFDWFTPLQYKNEHVMGVAPGWLRDPETLGGAETRAYLARVIPLMLENRALIESGALLLVPKERVIWENALLIQTLAREVSETLADRLESLSRQFRPRDLPREDTIRGLFASAGVDADATLRQHFGTAILYFAREFVTAQSVGSTYQAPFPWERYLTSVGLGLGSPSSTTDVGLTRTNLPIFQGLSPAVLARVRDDPAFAAFREELTNTYASVPLADDTRELDAYIQEREEVYLLPRIREAEQSVDRGALARLGLRLTGLKYQTTSAVLLAGQAIAAEGAPAGIAAALQLGAGLADHFAAAPPRTTTIWSNLVKHSRNVEQEIPGTTRQEGAETGGSNIWGLTSEASLTVRLTEGSFLWNWLPNRVPPAVRGGFSEGRYAPCPCGSGLKYKFCCEGYAIPDAYRPATWRLQ